MKSSGIVYRSRADVTPEMEFSALGNVYRFVLDCHAKKNAAGMTSTNGTILRNTKEVGDVERRPD
jgi:hypothetical protein